jgi:hypothetical protein
MKLTDKQKIVLCARVFHKWAVGDPSFGLELMSLGNGWSRVSAQQFLAGKNAQAVIEAMPDDEKDYPLLLHCLARDFCATCNLASVPPIDAIDRAKLEELAERLARGT